MLSPYRVLDLTDERGQLCGQLLADLGAEVILVEPPGGSTSRRQGPFLDDDPDANKSLWFWSYNRGKRSVVADIGTDEGRETIRRLAATSDFVIESFAPGYLAGIGLGYEDLSRLNPRVVLVSISPFGQTGPHSGWAASDLTVVASSGVLQMTGDEDRPPVRVVLPQAFLHASAEAAAGALLAHAARERDGVGQHVDVSAQTAMMMATQSFVLASAWHESGIERLAGGLKLGPITLKLVQPAKDGFVSVTFLFGNALGPFSRRLMEVMCERGFVDEATRDKDWLAYTTMLLSGEEPLSELMRCIDAIGRFTAAYTKQELLDLSFERRLLIVPVSTVEDVVHSPQLEAREYWTAVEHPEAGRSFPYPGPFAKFSATPLKYGRRAPRIGEDQELLAAPAPSPTHAAASTGTRGLPLAGVNVADFTWVMAGPAGSRYLADYGATQVKIESATRIDTARTLQPFLDHEVGPERSGLFANVNAGKLGLTLNLGIPEGRDLALRLVRWADVVVESYTPKAMKGWGLDYESLRAVKPDIVMLSSCLGGQYGPWSMLAGFGTMGAQLAGFGELAGWPDRPPAGPFGAYTDYIAPKFTALALLAALDHRRRTGEGQYIDLSQAECSLHFITPAILDYAANGRITRRNGNASPVYAPHAVFPCAGDDRWVAIVTETDEQWRGLTAALGKPGWATGPEFATAAGRLAHQAKIETQIGAWTCQREAADIENLLQAHGVPVFRSALSEDMLSDPQLVHRGHWVTVPHPELGPVVIENARSVLSATPARLQRAGPAFGQDNEYVLRELLGLGDDEIVGYLTAGALE
ncbi:MAG: CoA transferase [Chloroflexi bacterium]|nr:CoA transferase [Chloroflexota bacterium]